MSLQVNFTTHGHDLKAAYEAVLRPLDPKNGDNWALFGYDKGTNDLKVLGQGNGGLEELQEEFMDGKIQYAFVRIVDPYSQLNKFVLIAWCGDGVPESKKGLFNTHLADVARFLKGYHLQINARCEADVTPAQIMKRANEGSGSKYSTHQESYQQERIQPLQSAYKRTEIPDIAALQRNPTKPEPAPKYNLGGSKPFPTSSSPSSSSPSSSSSSTPVPSTPSRLQDRVWPPPPSASSSADVSSPPSSQSQPAERSWKTSAVGGSSYSAASTASSFNKVQPPSSLSSYGQSSVPEPVVNKAHQIRLEREAREKEERERIKREIAASEVRDRQSDSSSTAQKLAEERRLQEQREREREKERDQEVPQSQGFNRVREERLAREKEERERAEAEDSARAARETAKAREQSSVQEQAAAREAEQRREKEQQQKREREAQEAEARRAQEDKEGQQQQEEQYRQKQHEEESRRRQEEEEEERRLNQQQQEEEEEENKRRYEQEQEERRLQEEAEDQEARLQEEVSAATAQSVALGADALLASADHPELVASGSVSAIVLYSYEKAEENEMTLFEGELLRNVTELDVGWWSGESEDGTRSGLFPANYVEVIEHAHEHSPAAVIAAHEPEQQPHEHEQEHEQEHDHGHHDYTQEHAAVADHQEAHHETAGAGAQSNKPSAVALYDYQAGEPNEISFSEGEAIVEIEFVTEDWWSGKTEAGATGLFPANYVEIIAH